MCAENGSKEQEITVMKKLISIFLVGILSVMFFLTGCGQEEFQENRAGSADRPSLEVWFCYDRNVPGAYYVFLWDTLAEQYGYDITIETYSEQEIRDKLKMAMVCSELPDIFYVPGGSYPEYLFDAGACMPVQEYLSDAGFLEKYTLPSRDGNNYIIPCMADSYGVTYYDTGLMEKIGLEVPASWGELLEMVEKVHRYNEENGTDYAAIELGTKDKWMGELLYCMAALGADSETYQALEKGTASEESLDTLLLEASVAVQQLIDCGAFPEDYLETGEPEAVKNFINHDAVMMVHQSSLVYHLIQNMGKNGFRMESFPGCAGETDGEMRYHLMDMNDTYMPGLAVSSGSEYREEAAALSVEFALQVNQTNVEQHGYLNMTDSSLFADGYLFPQIQKLQEMERQADAGDAFLFAVLDQNTVDEWGNAMKQFFAGEMSAEEFADKSSSFMKK